MPPAKEDTGPGWVRVMPGFFETLGAKIILGRPITDGDIAATRKVAVVNHVFVKRFFKSQNPIGQHFGIDRIKYSITYEIVGVTNDVRYTRPVRRKGESVALRLGTGPPTAWTQQNQASINSECF